MISKSVALRPSRSMLEWALVRREREEGARRNKEEEEKGGRRKKDEEEGEGEVEAEDLEA